MNSIFENYDSSLRSNQNQSYNQIRMSFNFTNNRSHISGQQTMSNDNSNALINHINTIQNTKIVNNGVSMHQQSKKQGLRTEHSQDEIKTDGQFDQ